MVKEVALGPERSGGFTLECLELESGVLAKEVQFFYLYFEVLDRPESDAHVIFIAMVIVGDDCGVWFVGLVCGSISSAADR